MGGDQFCACVFFPYAKLSYAAPLHTHTHTRTPPSVVNPSARHSMTTPHNGRTMARVLIAIGILLGVAMFMHQTQQPVPALPVPPPRTAPRSRPNDATQPSPTTVSIPTSFPPMHPAALPSMHDAKKLPAMPRSADGTLSLTIPVATHRPLTHDPHDPHDPSSSFATIRIPTNVMHASQAIDDVCSHPHQRDAYSLTCRMAPFNQTSNQQHVPPCASGPPTSPAYYQQIPQYEARRARVNMYQGRRPCTLAAL